MITPGQVSQALNIPPSTLRRWSVKFADHLTPQRSPGSKRVYTDSDLQIFERIKSLSADGLTLEAVAELLPVEVIDKPVDQSTALLSLKDYRSLIDSAFSSLAEVSNEVELHAAKIQKYDDRLQKLENWLALPWYKRIGTRPPK